MPKYSVHVTFGSLGKDGREQHETIQLDIIVADGRAAWQWVVSEAHKRNAWTRNVQILRIYDNETAKPPPALPPPTTALTPYVPPPPFKWPEHMVETSAAVSVQAYALVVEEDKPDANATG